MAGSIVSRRDFFGASAGSAMAGAGALALADPGGAAAQAVGIRRGDLPDLTIKEIKVYVVDPGKVEGVESEAITT